MLTWRRLKGEHVEPRAAGATEDDRTRTRTHLQGSWWQLSGKLCLSTAPARPASGSHPLGLPERVGFIQGNREVALWSC